MTVPELVAEMNVPDYDKLHQRSKITCGLYGLEKFGLVSREIIEGKIYWKKRRG